MPNEENPFARLAAIGWRLEFHEGEKDAMAVEILRGGHRKGRMMLSRPGEPRDMQIARLRARAIEWIEEYSRREHDGDTDYGDLS